MVTPVRLELTLPAWEAGLLDLLEEGAKYRSVDLVDRTRIEHATSWVQIRRSPNWATGPKGGVL